MIATIERRQILTYDRVIKTRAWTSLLIVNPKGDAEVNGLLAFCPRLKITLVWDPEFLTPRAPPTEGMRRAAVLARLWVTAGANPRLTVHVGPPLVAAATLAGFQHEGVLPLFSGAVLAQLDHDRPLAPQLRAWAALVAPEGMLIGKLHGDIKVRSELAMAAPRWRPWPFGLWLVEVGGLSLGPVLPSHADRADRGAVAPLPLLKQLGIVLPIKRTRPVWETLELNLK